MKTELTFDEWMQIGTALNSLPSDEKENIMRIIERVNNRVREVETTLNNIQYNIESINR